MTDMLWGFIFLQMMLGGFDTLWHHELTERLAWRPSQAGELKLAATAGLPMDSALTSAEELPPILALSVDLSPSDPRMADRTHGELQR